MTATDGKTTGTSRRRTAAKQKDDGGVVLEVVNDTAAPVDTPKRAKTVRDLSATGVGIIGGISDAEPEEVPASGKVADVEWLLVPMETSFSEDTWKSFVAMDEAAAKRSIRLAADKLGYGVTTRTEEVEVADEDGSATVATRLFFKARTRIVKTSKNSQGE